MGMTVAKGMTMGTDSAKEKTLRQALAECEKSQEEIFAQLTKNFAREPEPETVLPQAKVRPNVLDEIIDTLQSLHQAQRRTIEFLIERVNSKL